MLVSVFMVNYMLKIPKGVPVESVECLHEDERKKKNGQILYIMGRDNQMAINVKLLVIMHKSYGFSADLIETINY